MSRVGKHPVEVPGGVTVNISGQQISAKGKLGELSHVVVDEVLLELADNKIVLKPRDNSQRARMMWGMSRAVVANLVKGVATGFTKNLEIEGVGYRAAVQGKDLVLQLGFSHEVRYPIPKGITVTCERPTVIAISGADIQVVGQMAAEIREYRPPEPYKGKGVRYAGEYIRRKEGKKK
jgi:large subunit ribosomal protein L6